MLRFTILFLIGLRNIQMQPATCNDDIHCSVGFFCHTMTHACHECLTCENLGRSPTPIENTCIKSGDQCGPCLQGLIIDDLSQSGAACVSPELRSLLVKLLILSICILILCVGTYVLLSRLIVHGDRIKRVINVNIAVLLCKKITSQPAYLESLPACTKVIKNEPNGWTA